MRDRSHPRSPSAVSPKQIYGEASTSWSLVQGQKRDWICSLVCKKKNNEVAAFKDAQAAEKHIMREHPDPMYDKFVCLKDGCQILALPEGEGIATANP